MLSRMLLGQRQAVKVAASLTSRQTCLLAMRQTSRLRPQLVLNDESVTRRSTFSRPFSSETPAEKSERSTQEEEAKNQEVSGTKEDEEDLLRKELENKQKEIVDLKDKYVRSVADFLNLQERTKRDMENARNFAIQRFAVDLLESIDNFDRALLAVPEEKLKSAETEANKDIVDLVNGLKMTQNILMNTLKKHGLERFDPSEPTEEGKRQKFDPNLHEATFMTKAENMEDGDIMYTQSKGFRLNGRVLRAAKVGVVKNT